MAVCWRVTDGPAVKWRWRLRADLELFDCQRKPSSLQRGSAAKKKVYYLREP